MSQNVDDASAPAAQEASSAIVTSIMEIPTLCFGGPHLVVDFFLSHPIHWPYSIETRELRMNLVARGSTNFVRVNNAEDADREHHSLPSSLQRKFLVSCHFTPVSLGRRMGTLSGRVREGGRERERGRM